MPEELEAKGPFVSLVMFLRGKGRTWSEEEEEERVRCSVGGGIVLKGEGGS